MEVGCQGICWRGNKIIFEAPTQGLTQGRVGWKVSTVKMTLRSDNNICPSLTLPHTLESVLAGNIVPTTLACE